MSVAAASVSPCDTAEIARMRELFARQRHASRRDAPPSVAARRDALQRLRRLIIDNEARIVAAISADFGHRSPDETKSLEILTTVASLQDAIDHVGRWMRPERRRAHWTYQPVITKLVPQPLGVVGIISPWNYPLAMLCMPLAGAMAAGNRCLIKPSEFTPRFTDVLGELLSSGFDEVELGLVNGGADVGAAFSQLPFDHLLFTGSTTVGRKVMRAAADNLTPVTLELSGKSPAVLAPDAQIDAAIESLCFAKWLNAGQTCVAPDYVFVPVDRRDAFVEAARATLSRFYPRLQDNDQYSSVITDQHYRRLCDLVDDAERRGATIVRFDPADEGESLATRKMRPTLVLDATTEMQIMQDEVFGPVLPVVSYSSFDDVIEAINARPRPLAAYLYTDDAATRRQFGERTVSGALCINTCMIHVGVEALPFGGVGDSGMGRYHGREGFLTFSHHKPVLRQLRPEPIKLFYPPYGKLVERVRKFLRGK